MLSPPLTLFIVMLPGPLHFAFQDVWLKVSDHTILFIWVMKIFFLYSSSVYSCHLFLICSASVRSVLFSALYCAHLCMKCSLGISNSLEETSSLSHSIVFPCFFAMIAEEDFLISPCYFLELCIQTGISFPFSFAFSLSSFLSYL